MPKANRLHKPIIITIGNQKGGVGKTTTSVNLAMAIGGSGSKVLVIDADPQGNCSSILMQDIRLREQYSLTEALQMPPGEAGLTTMACRTRNPMISIVPNTLRCMLWERQVATQTDSVLGFQRLLANDPKIAEYDFVLIDTPPNISTMVNNALMISDYVLIPVPASDQFALDGLAALLRIIQSIRGRNQSLKLLGIIITRFHEEVDFCEENRQRIKNYFTKIGINVFPTSIRTDMNIERAHMKRQSILEFAPGSAGAQDYVALAREIQQVMQHEKARKQ